MLLGSLVISDLVKVVCLYDLHVGIVVYLTAMV